MNQDNKSILVISYDEKDIYKIDVEKPNVDAFVKEILTIKDIDKDKIKVTTDLKDFDTELFTEMIQEYITELTDALELNLKNYNDYINSITKDEL